MTPATGALVALATAAALWLRLAGLTGWDGTLSVDEARLTLAARGILDHGTPVLPSGWTYTRGVLASYAAAPSLAILGPSDFAARLPSVLAGAALIPVLYLLGATVAGRIGGLFAALFVVAYPPLVVWSRQAWLYAFYVLLFCAALLCIVRAQRSGRRRDQVLAGALVGLTLVAHELGIFLLAPLAVQVALGLRRVKPDVVGLGLALALALGAVLALFVLVTGLRAPTLVGRYGEIAEYFRPHLEGVPFRFYGRMLVDGRWLVLLAALAGFPLAIAHRRSEAALLWLALLPPFVHAVTVIPESPQERYSLTFIPILVVLAALAVRDLATWAVARFSLQYSPDLLAGVALGLILLAHQNLPRAVERAALSPRDGAWLAEARALGIAPDDLLMSDLPTVVGWYLGGLDFWVSSRDYQKYTVQQDEVRRDLHTGAILVRNRAEFQRLVAQPNPGRTLWLIASGRGYQWGELVDDDLKSFLERAATQRVNSADGFRIYQIQL